jgi:phosphoribosyl 1,2-cyclic phosphodiesterase
MKVSFWGTRGSLATPGKTTLRYGGNTSCVQVTGDEGTVLVLDAGTGIRELSLDLPQNLRRVDVVLSHLHMDHIQGLGFFAPLYHPDMEVHIWGPASTTMDLRTRLTRYLSPPLFPVHLRDLPCKLHIHDDACMDVDILEFRVSSILVAHPGPTVGIRIEGPQGSLAYMPDHEPVLGALRFLPDRDWISGMSVAQNVDMLIHDSQYTDTEYVSRIGWGHSSMRQALEFARMAEVGHLVPFHYDPRHTDDDLDHLFAEILSEISPAFPVDPAKEGTDLIVRKR